ncbi:electron transfer flavoprotein subunit beta/FixA family protein [Thermogemmatispora sp.]|uniref:electron transfer flavoprotein subunit beta/FixA family protein n=1 Tax=Thermogemmatispora sp. TaxID=1968838 RepID=UPI0035E41D18
MRIAVCLKQAPDSSSVYVDPISGEVDRERFVQSLNAADACALEAALRLKEKVGGSILALTVGPEESEEVLRVALAMGADSVERLWHASAADWGPLTIAAALAARLRADSALPELIFCGEASSDWASGTVGPALAAYLGLPQITGVIGLEPLEEDGSLLLRLSRRLERGYRERLLAKPPLLLTVHETLNEPRYPSLPAHLAALQATIAVSNPLELLQFACASEAEETTIVEVRTPRPRPHRIPIPDSQLSPFERIGAIITGGTARRQTRLVEGSAEELARELVRFLRERGFA